MSEPATIPAERLEAFLVPYQGARVACHTEWRVAFEWKGAPHSVPAVDLAHAAVLRANYHTVGGFANVRIESRPVAVGTWEEERV
jgi:hypothetical protein